MHWSPTGKQAIISGGSDALFVTDVGAKFKKLPGSGRVISIAWLPDSHHFAGVRGSKTRDWNVYAKVLGQKRAHAISTAAEELIPAIRKYQGQWDDFEKDLAVNEWKSDHEPFGPDLATAMLCLQATHPDVVAPVLKAWQEQLDEAHRADEAKWEAEFTELFIEDAAAEAKTERVLFQSADLISNAVCSPDGGAIAFTVSTANDGEHLKEISVEGGEAIEVDNGVMAVDWTPDGTQLIYAKSDALTKGTPNAWVAGSITRRRIRDQKGNRLPELENSEELADLLLGGSVTRLACLPDGRVLFATPDVHPPLLKNDVPEVSTLFVLNPSVPSIDRVVSPEVQKQLPSRPDCFVVNRDGTRIAVPGENGELAVISLADGKVTQLQAKVANFDETEKPGDKTELKFLLPAWMTPNEISYAIPAGAPDGNPDRAEIVLQEIGGARRVISTEWPDDAVAWFLPKKEK